MGNCAEVDAINNAIIDEMLAILEKEKVELPNPKAVSFSKFSERDGWGNDFDGKGLSRII